jgi:hypothetical protein
MGQVAFPPEPNQCRRIIHAWSLLLRKAKGGKVSSRLLQRTLNKAELSASCRTLSETNITQHLTEAYRDYYRTKSESNSLRQNHLENLAEALAEDGSEKKEQLIKTRITQEKQRASARRIRFLHVKMRSGSTTMVTVTNAEGEKIDITDRAGLEVAILKNNQDKFTQSVHTPFYNFPLQQEFGFQGTTSATQAVLAGSMTPIIHWTNISWMLFSNGRCQKQSGNRYHHPRGFP